jgi:membrane-bound serine protease (ClpP class)
VINLAAGFFGGIIAILAAARYLPETVLFRPFRLSTTSPTGSVAITSSLSLRETGKTLTDLRPSGAAKFNGKSFDVLAEGHFIPKGTTVQIHQIEGATIFVKAVRNTQKDP